MKSRILVLFTVIFGLFACEESTKPENWPYGFPHEVTMEGRTYSGAAQNVPDFKTTIEVTDESNGVYTLRGSSFSYSGQVIYPFGLAYEDKSLLIAVSRDRRFAFSYSYDFSDLGPRTRIIYSDEFYSGIDGQVYEGVYNQYDQDQQKFNTGSLRATIKNGAVVFGSAGPQGFRNNTFDLNENGSYSKTQGTTRSVVSYTKGDDAISLIYLSPDKQIVGILKRIN